MTPDGRPTYRIEEAARRVGIPAASLRAWERRYGITRPARTGKGYRLYSELDLHWLARMKAVVDGGVAAAEAARRVHEEQITHRVPRLADAVELRESVLEAACDFDGATLERLLTTVSRAFTPEAGVRDVLAPALVELGKRWADNRVDVPHAHWLTHRLSAYMVSLLATMRAHATRGVVVLACFPDEQHDVACYVLAVHLAARGYRPVVLGARTPPKALAVAVRELDPELVCISLTNAATPADRQSVREYVSVCGDLPLWVGGQGAASLGALPEGVQLAGATSVELLDAAVSTRAANVAGAE